MDDRTKSDLPPGERPSDRNFVQAGLSRAYIEVMRRMSGLPSNADPRTVALIFSQPARNGSDSVSSRPVMVSASLLSIDSFAPVALLERRERLPAKREAERRLNTWGPEAETRIP